jgi:hypothetical protein
MRDIRDDLKERLSLLRAERDALQAQLKSKLAEIDVYEQQLTTLLALEEARAGPPSQAPPSVAVPPAAELAETETEALGEGSDEEFEADIMKILSDGKAREHPVIRAEMEDMGWKSTKPGTLGRQIQGVLLTLKNRGALEYVGDRVWRKAKVGAANAA